MSGPRSPEARNCTFANSHSDPGTHDPEEEATCRTPHSIPAAEAPSVPLLPLGDLIPYALLTALLAMMLLYFVGAEEGATSVFPGMTLHEWVHDARHLLGFPCH